MNTREDWGFFSPQAEARLQTIMGLQTYNSIRALDWLAGRDDVDPQRIGVTGASGGGTQTFILAAIDPRPAAAFPAVMVSTAMQGGCTCENASYLRVGTGNVEIAALIAPRPLGMTAADDWTKEIATKGLPELKAHYFGYNYPLFAQRVHDVLSLVSFARNTLGAAKVHLVGLGGAGHWVLAARASPRGYRPRGRRHGRLPFRPAHGHRRSRLPAGRGQVP